MMSCNTHMHVHYNEIMITILSQSNNKVDMESNASIVRHAGEL